MDIGAIFNTFFLIPLINALIFFYKILNQAHIPGSLGFSIIILTILIRGILWPLTNSQLRSARKMADLKPHLDALKEKHTDKAALQQAQMALYKEHGVNPAAGCLPVLVQFPILIALYQAIIHVFPIQAKNMAGGLQWINSILYSDWLKLSAPPDPNFFGLNLANRPSQFGTVGIFILAVPLVTALLTFIQSRMMIPAKPLKLYPNDSPKEVKEKESFEDAMSSMQGSMMYMMPIMIGYFAFNFPAGLAIYWNMVTILGIVQQYLISGWGGMTEIFARIGIKVSARNVESKTKVKVERGLGSNKYKSNK